MTSVHASGTTRTASSARPRRAPTRTPPTPAARAEERAPDTRRESTPPSSPVWPFRSRRARRRRDGICGHERRSRGCRAVPRRACAGCWSGGGSPGCSADGPGEPVRDAVAAFRNEDGGFGHALEPDGRGPESQPAAVLTALSVLDECDAWDDELARSACDWLATTEPDGGGTPFVMPGVEAWPHGPWWRPAEGLPASLTTTGQVLEPLLARGVEHPWVERATAWLWSRVERPGRAGPLRRARPRRVPRRRARPRARASGGRAARAGARTPRPRRRGPAARPTCTAPIEYAPRPDSAARAAFDDAAARATTSTRSRPSSARTAAGCSRGWRGRRWPRPSGAAS